MELVPNRVGALVISEIYAPSRWERVLLYTGLVLGGVLIFWMVGQRDDLAGQHSELRDRLRSPQPGYSVPTFTNRTIDGAPITLGEREVGRQLVFFFTTTCEFCLASLPAWREITDRSVREHADVEVVGVVLDADGPVAEYRDRHGLRFPITTFPQEKLSRLYRAGSVPLVALRVRGRSDVRCATTSPPRNWACEYFAGTRNGDIVRGVRSAPEGSGRCLGGVSTPLSGQRRRVPSGARVAVYRPLTDAESGRAGQRGVAAVVVALDAIDHSVVDPRFPDLSNADFELLGSG